MNVNVGIDVGIGIGVEVGSGIAGAVGTGVGAGIGVAVGRGVGVDVSDGWVGAALGIAVGVLAGQRPLAERTVPSPLAERVSFTKSFRLLFRVAPDNSAVFISTTESFPAHIDCARSASPDTCGAAIEVPLREAYLLLG